MTDSSFWQNIDKLVAENTLIIDRPAGTTHPRYPDFVYPLDYGYLQGTSAADGDGIDVWRGSLLHQKATGVICTIDLVKKDTEIKILLGCTANEAQQILQTHNTGPQGGTLVIRPSMVPPTDRYGPETLAQTPTEVAQRHQANRQAWNEGAVSYAADVEETIAFLRAGKSSMHPIEQQLLGNLGDWCETAIHLQCASGRDTLSMWNEGAKRVIGVDISDLHIENARRTSDALNAPAEWFCCDVLDTPASLTATADLVYTGRGALNWLHDLDAWAATIVRLLKPNGVFLVYDGHPASWLFEPEADTLIPSGISYFHYAEWAQGWSVAYLGDLGKPLEEHAIKHERLWPLSEVVQSLVDAGLTIEALGEYPDDYWDSFPYLDPAMKATLPVTFAIRARKT